MKAHVTTSSIFQQGTSAAPNSAGTGTRDIRDRRSFLTWSMRVRYRPESPKGETQPIVSTGQIPSTCMRHSKMSTYWFALRWVSFLKAGLDAHPPMMVTLTESQELRHCSGSPCPYKWNYNRMLSKGYCRHETWKMRYQNKAVETLYKCQESTSVQRHTAHEG